jgi:hypothetical protein
VRAGKRPASTQLEAPNSTSVTILRVASFSSVKQAKDFLAGRIAAEASRENVSLSETERKMLYWSETDWTLPDMKSVGAEFDRDYDQKEYERKIGGLVANIIAERHHHNEAEEAKWDGAVDKLSEGDHYLTVLINEGNPSEDSFLSLLTGPFFGPPHDRLKLLLVSIALVVVFLTAMTSVDWFLGTKLWAATGWDIDEHEVPGVALIVLFLTAVLAWKIYRFIRSRSRPE